jgi:hypothetical protein
MGCKRCNRYAILFTAELRAVHCLTFKRFEIAYSVVAVSQKYLDKDYFKLHLLVENRRLVVSCLNYKASEIPIFL